jgi:hypothetical protein
VCQYALLFCYCLCVLVCIRFVCLGLAEGPSLFVCHVLVESCVYWFLWLKGHCTCAIHVCCSLRQLCFCLAEGPSLMFVCQTWFESCVFIASCLFRLKGHWLCRARFLCFVFWRARARFLCFGPGSFHQPLGVFLFGIWLFVSLCFRF